MKKLKLFITSVLLVSSFSLASCGLLDDINDSTTTKTSDTDTGTKTTEDDNTKYTVTFDSKGGSTITSQEVKKGNKVTKPADPTKDGYTFGGWYSDSYYINEYSFNSKVTKDLTLYAKWNEIPKTVLYEVGNSTVDLWTDSIGSKWMKIAIPVKNTGTADLYLGSASADIETSTGTLLKTESYITGFPQYIKPGETGYYYVATSRDFTETDIRVVPHVDVRKATNDVIRYDISEVTLSEDSFSLVLAIIASYNEFPRTSAFNVPSLLNAFAAIPITAEFFFICSVCATIVENKSSNFVL